MNSSQLVIEQVGARVLHAHADHGLRVLAQLGHQRREIGVAADDDEGVDVLLGVAEVERVDHHADVGRVLARLAHVRDLDQLEGRGVHRRLEFLVAVPVAVGLLHHDRALGEQALEHLPHVELRVLRLAHAERDVLEVAEHRQAAASLLAISGSSRGDCGESTAAAPAAREACALAPALDQRVAGGHHHQGEQRRGDHAADHGDATAARWSRRRRPGRWPRAASARMMVSEVISTGRMRIGQASRSASSTLMPCSRRWLVRSTSRIEFFATRPISSTRPMPE